MLSNQVIKDMELQVLVSKKGTKVVTATNLHQALELPNQHFLVNVKKWLNDWYEFKDGIRKPVRLQDYGPRRVKDNPILDDYYFSVEFAKMVALRTKSKAKLKVSKQLLALSATDAESDPLTAQQMLHIMELTKAMSMVSCQEASEREHLRTYKNRNNGEAVNWWTYRAKILGYDADELRDKLRRRGQSPKGKSQRELIASVDRLELIRAGIIDLFMALGKPAAYAQKMGDLSKMLAQELHIEIFDDRHGQSLFTPPINPRGVRELEAILADAA